MNDMTAFVKEHWLLLSAVVLCPCHLPFTLSLLATLSAGTTVGALLGGEHRPLIEVGLAVVLSLYMLGAMSLWIWHSNAKARRASDECEACSEPLSEAESSGSERRPESEQAGTKPSGLTGTSQESLPQRERVGVS